MGPDRLMGDMGRTYDGGYAEYTSVPLAPVIPVDTGKLVVRIRH
jgi:hypothetical protein